MRKTNQSQILCIYGITKSSFDWCYEILSCSIKLTPLFRFLVPMHFAFIFIWLSGLFFIRVQSSSSSPSSSQCFTFHLLRLLVNYFMRHLDCLVVDAYLRYNPFAMPALREAGATSFRLALIWIKPNRFGKAFRAERLCTPQPNGLIDEGIAAMLSIRNIYLNALRGRSFVYVSIYARLICFGDKRTEKSQSS